MTVGDRRAAELTRLLEETSTAHHLEYSGEHPEWANWYAERLAILVEPLFDHQPSVGEVSDWLTRADRLHREEAPDEPWPAYFASAIIQMADGKRTV
jgi:hypothetical protein